MTSSLLGHYENSVLINDLWKRQELSPRDRSIVTVSALIARNHTSLLPRYVALALDNGVKPAEIAEIVTHLAFYSGWGNAAAATSVIEDIFAERKIGADQLPENTGARLEIDETIEARRAAIVDENVGPVFQGLVDYTTNALFKELWLRPALAPRDRSLATMSALISVGQVVQIQFHLDKAMENGLTQEEAAEVITHLAFYVGWPNAMNAVPVAKGIFEKRSA
jgi:4-carboxymuconolactone decarboxylase